MSPSAPQSHEGEAIPHSLRDLLTIVFKRRWLILGVLAATVTIVMLISLSKPRIYQVAATLIVNEARAEMQIGPTDSTQLVVNRVNETTLNSETEVLKGRKLIEDVVQKLDAEEPLKSEPSSVVSPGDNEQPDAGFNAIVLGIQTSLDVSVVKDTNMIRVSYSSSDPAWATRVIGTLVDEYLRQRAERYKSPQAVLFFKQQMDDAEERLRRREEALEGFIDEASITIVDGSAGSDSLAAQKGLVMQRLGGLESSLGSAEVELESQLRQVASLQAMLSREPERLESSSNLDAASEEFERALASLRLERDALLQDFKPDSRHVRDIDRQINMAEERLQQARGTSAVIGTEANPLYLQLKGDLLSAETALEGTRARVDSLRAQVSEYRKELDHLNAKAFGLGDLRRDANSAEEDYLLYRKKHEEARISAAMDQEKFINVTIAQPAQMPLNPEPRGLVPRLFLSVFLSLLGGVGWAFVQETVLDRSFTTAEDVEKRLGISHIASIPDGEAVGF